MVTLLQIFCAECASEIILEIGQYLTNLYENDFIRPPLFKSRVE